jgi:hypothetical protein
MAYISTKGVDIAHFCKRRVPSRWICHNALLLQTKVRQSKMSELLPDRVAYCKKLHSTVNSLFPIVGSHDGVLPPVTYASIYGVRKIVHIVAAFVVDEAAYQGRFCLLSSSAPISIDSAIRTLMRTVCPTFAGLLASNIPYLVGARRIRIFAHNDLSGQAAAERWDGATQPSRRRAGQHHRHRRDTFF